MAGDDLELFLKNCGADQPGAEFLLRADGHPPPFSLSRQPFALIGSDARNSFPLADRSVNPRHAYVQMIAGNAFCVDLASFTGVTWPEGRRTAHWLELDRPVRLGEVTLRLTQPPNSASPPAPPERGSPLKRNSATQFGATEATIEFSEGVKRNPRMRLNRALTLVGNAPGCRIRAYAAEVSRHHCSLVSGPLGIWVVDLLSRAGVVVNGERVRWAHLANGDRVRVGPVVMRVWYEEPPASEGPAELHGGLRPHAFPGGSPVTSARKTMLLPPPAAAVEPFPAAQAGAEGPMALAILQQFGVLQQQFNLMQQQLFEQFHQAMLVLAQMFMAAHKERAALVRGELEEVHRLTQELQRLRATQMLPSAALPGLPPGENGTGSARADEEATTPAEGAAARTAASPRDEWQTEQPEPPGGGPAAQRAAGPEPSAPPKPEDAVPAGPAEAGVHEWLCRRVAALEKERHGRWQKVLTFLRGGGS
jgi:hypothetical protein